MRIFQSRPRYFVTGLATLFVAVVLSQPASSQHWLNPDDDNRTNRSTFRQIDEWPDPNEYRNAAGAPGPRYWQQRVDYVIETSLDTVDHVVSGSERMTYHNNSPDNLPYLWIQLDQNLRSIEHSRTFKIADALPESMSPMARRFLSYKYNPFDGGYTISRVQVEGAGGRMVDADYHIRGTIMKVKLKSPVESGGSTAIEIDWSFPVPTTMARGAREEVGDGWLYEVAQWFPRANVYDDVNGWQTDQFLGRGEFYLNFGNYDVSITVPFDHIVDATGVLQNPEDVLTSEQRRRLKNAYESDEPVFIVRPEEVMTSKSRPATSGMLTWHFKAENVRDFAWVSSKAYVWDAAGFRYNADEEPIAIHSLYPREAMPLWDKVSTRAVLQTMRTYGRMSLKYPYPKATNVHGPVFGMEYPMIAFCGARPSPDGSYTDGLERALISVTIHEVGHNWFPMIVASDERKWTWMDEGLNSFLQYYGEQDYARFYAGDAWTQTDDGSYPSRRGPGERIVDYMRDPDQVPIMTQSDLIHKDFGENGYAKPATGLVILREQIVGPEIFDEAFREYSERWAFKHPQPADFFRSIEEGTGEYLAWFWRGWFYTTHANDQAIMSVTAQPADSLVGSVDYGKSYYRLQVENKGGLLMPLHIQVTYDDDSEELFELPADAWRANEKTFTKGFFSDRNVVRVELDPKHAFADIDRENNVWSAPAIREGEQTNTTGS
ncbi:MAG: M1 family metallopeptidase [Rhodothermales bacterium]|nr:M1 family metallopeptidase [Rhodothermales bacterium]